MNSGRRGVPPRGRPAPTGAASTQVIVPTARVSRRRLTAYHPLTVKRPQPPSPAVGLHAWARAPGLGDPALDRTNSAEPATPSLPAACFDASMPVNGRRSSAPRQPVSNLQSPADQPNRVSTSPFPTCPAWNSSSSRKPSPRKLPHQQRPVGHRSRAVARAGAKSATQTGNLRVLPPCPGWRLPPRPPILGERDVFPPGLGGRGAAHQARFQSLACGGARPGQATSSLILRTLAAVFGLRSQDRDQRSEIRDQICGRQKFSDL